MEQMIRSVSPNPLAIFVMQRGSIWYMWFANHDFSISCFFFLGTRVQTNALPKKHPRRRPQNAMGQIVGCTAKWWPEAVEHQVIFSSWPNKIRKPPHSWITKEGPILATSLSSLGPARFSGGGTENDRWVLEGIGRVRWAFSLWFMKISWPTCYPGSLFLVQKGFVTP
jgi:hypothetical protein